MSAKGRWGAFIMKVFIKTVPGRETATRIHEYRDSTSGKPLNKGKVGRCTDGYCAQFSSKIGAYNTGGLLDRVDNPYFGESKDFLGKDWEYLADKKEVTRQEVLEKKHGRSPGYYTNQANFFNNDGKTPKTYIQKLKLTLNDGTTIFNTDIPDDEVRYYIALGHQKIANSLEEYRQHKWPKATHYISQVDEDVEFRIKHAKVRNKAIARLEDEDFIDENKLMLIKAAGWNNRQSSIRPKAMYDIINEKLQASDVAKEGNDIDKFNRLYDMFKTPVGREELYAMAFLTDLVDNRVVSVVKDTYTWVSKGIILGNRKTGEDSVISYLTDPSKAPEHKDLRLELTARQVV